MTPRIQRAALWLSVVIGLVAGALYLALGGASLASLWTRDTRVAGVAWTIFGVLHLGYHVGHLGHMDAVDALGNVVTLGLSLLVGVVLLVPVRQHTTAVAR